jgi:hypothetical protein
MVGRKYRDTAVTLEKLISIVHKTGLKIISLNDRYAKLMLPAEPNINE